MGRFEWWYFHSSMTTGCRVNWQNVIKLAFLSLRHLTFRQITQRPVAVEEWEYLHSNWLIERVEWWYSHSSTTTGCRVYWQNVIKLALSLSILRHLTFRRISRHPVVVKEWEYHHSTCLEEPVRMVVFLFFYDHWI